MFDVVENWDGTGELPPLYTRTATGAVNIWRCWVRGPDVVVSWGQVGGAMQESSFRCEAKNVGRANATNEVDQAIREAIAKWKKQVKKKYHWDVSGSGNTRHKPMLAKKWEEHKDKIEYPVVVQPKYDGVRAFGSFDGMYAALQSRGGDPYKVAHIQEEIQRVALQHDLLLDGELYVHGVSLQRLNSLVKTQQEESSLLTFRVYDVAHLTQTDMPYVERRELLAKLFADHRDLKRAWVMVQAVPDQLAYNEADVLRIYSELVERGFEGAIVRSLGHPYRFGYRSDGLLKVKAWRDAEFVIVGHTVGKGKAINYPVFTCATPEGKHFDVIPKGSAEERMQLLQRAPNLVGQLLKVQFFDYTDAGIPHFPVGLGLRSHGDL